MKLFALFLCVTFITKANCARILVYIPSPSISHQEPFRPLTQELARRGHEVVVITADPAFPKGKTPANLTEIDLHDISYDVVKKIFRPESRGKKEEWIQQVQSFTFDFFHNLLDKQFGTNEVLQVIRDGKFDLLIFEAIARPLLGLTHLIKAPVILVSSLGPMFDISDAIGIPSHPMLYPVATRQKLLNLTLWEKFNEIYNHYKIQYLAYRTEDNINKMLQKHFGKDMPTINKLKNNIDMLFLNIHPVFEGSHPVPPSVVYIWGVHKKPRKELPNDIKSYLDSSKHGVIYMSFGTNTDPTFLPQETMQIFVNVFCQLPYDVLWKWNADNLPGQCNNIRLGKWFPQSDLLRHPNVKLFITQGGIQSTDEAISAGVPLIGIPMIGDQWYNVEKYVHFKMGVGLDFETFTEEEFRNAVTTVIQDESYRQNIKKLDALMRDEPLSALERAVWWTEHVLRHGGARHLRAPAANISWAQYLELELVVIILISFLGVFVLGIFSLWFLWRLINKYCFTKVKTKRH